MNCQQCHDVLDNLLVAEPSAAEEAALVEHLEKCPDCAGQYAQARRALALLAVAEPLAAADDFKARIVDAVFDTRGLQAPQTEPTAVRVGANKTWKRMRPWPLAAALAAAAVLLIAGTLLWRADRGQRGQSAFGLLAEACAAEENQFKGKQIVHLASEIIVEPVADPALAQIRWLPLASLEATGKLRFSQLTLPAEVNKGYSVEDQSWYDPATGRFARVLTRDGKPIFANSYDGTNVYALESPAGGPPRIVSHAIAKDFQVPKNPAEFLGMAAGLRSGLDVKDENWVRSVEKTRLDDGAEAQIVKVKLGLGNPDAKETMDSYWLVTIRLDGNTLEREEWFAQGKSMLVIRRDKASPDEAPGVGWDLAELAKQLAAAVVATWPKILPDMLLLDVSVEQMVKKADFKTYMFGKAPPWAEQRQIADMLDVASPPHRMFLIAYQTKDHRHVVLLQSFTYNANFGRLLKTWRLVYTSPTGVKVWSGPARRGTVQDFAGQRDVLDQGSAWEGTHRLRFGNAGRHLSRPGHQRQAERGRAAWADRQPGAGRVGGSSTRRLFFAPLDMATLRSHTAAGRDYAVLETPSPALSDPGCLEIHQGTSVAETLLSDEGVRENYVLITVFARESRSRPMHCGCSILSG